MPINASFQDNDNFRSVTEHDLILTAVSLNPVSSSRIIEILRGPVDWALFRNLAIKNGILPLCSHRLLSIAHGQIPPDEITYFNDVLLASKDSNLRLTWKLIECLDLLDKNGIDALTLKGPVLALQAYGDLNLRHFIDLDILVRRNDLPKAYQILARSGYTPTMIVDSRQLKFLVNSDNHFSFIRQGDTFELHWEIGPYENIHPLTQELVWQNLTTFRVYEKEIYTLSPENTIFYTSLHGAKHGWKQLKWIVDVAQLFCSYPENSWLTLFEQAQKFGLFRQLSLGLILAEDMVGISLPTRIHDLIRSDYRARELSSQVKASLFNDQQPTTQEEDYLFYLKTRERLLDRLHYLFDLIILPKKPDWLIVSLPEKLYFLYYLLRPLRLFSLAIKAATSKLSRFRK